MKPQGILKHGIGAYGKTYDSKLVLNLDSRISASITEGAGAVSDWVDVVGNHNFEQDNAGDKPSYAANRVTFNDDFMSAGDIPSLELSAFSVHVVLKRDGIGDTQYIWCQQGDISKVGDDSAGGCFLRFTSDNELGLVSYSEPAIATTAYTATSVAKLTDTTNYHLFTGIFGVTALKIYLDGTLIASGPYPGAGYRKVRATAVGGAMQSQGGANANRFRGKLGQVLVYDGAHTHSKAVAVSNQIMADWSIS